MDKKLRNLTGILAMTTACALGGESNSVYRSSSFSLTSIYKAIPAPLSSHEVPTNSFPGLLTSTYSHIEQSCERIIYKGKEQSEKLADLAHDFLATAWTVSSDTKDSSTYVYLYYQKVF